MECGICGRDNLTLKELDVHAKFFHKVPGIMYQQPQRFALGVCPDCGSTLWFQEGCVNCQTCGFSKCG